MNENIHKTVESLPLGLYFVSDATYTLSEKMLIHFTGSQRIEHNINTFNFHLSTLRIIVEMSFGFLFRKFHTSERFGISLRNESCYYHVM